MISIQSNNTSSLACLASELLQNHSAADGGIIARNAEGAVTDCLMASNTLARLCAQADLKELGDDAGMNIGHAFLMLNEMALFSMKCHDSFTQS